MVNATDPATNGEEKKNEEEEKEEDILANVVFMRGTCYFCCYLLAS